MVKPRSIRAPSLLIELLRDVANGTARIYSFNIEFDADQIATRIGDDGTRRIAKTGGADVTIGFKTQSAMMSWTNIGPRERLEHDRKGFDREELESLANLVMTALEARAPQIGEPGSKAAAVHPQNLPSEDLRILEDIFTRAGALFEKLGGKVAK